MELLFNDEIAKETKYKGYFVTESGKVLTAKVKGGQGRIDYDNLREHCYKEDKDGYHEVLLSNNSDRKYMRVHRLVWETFNGEIPDDLTIDHMDSNKQNNDISNLRLLTRGINASIARKGKVPKVKAFYEYNGNIYDRVQLQNMFNFTGKFWYNENNKINDTDFIFEQNIFERVK